MPRRAQDFLQRKRLSSAFRAPTVRRGADGPAGTPSCSFVFAQESTARSVERKLPIEEFMMKRMLVMLAVMLVIIGGLGFVKFKQIQLAIAQGASFQPPPEAVTSVVAEEARWPSTLNAIGTMAPVRGVTVSADLAGIVEDILFESGEPVREGQVLVVLDARQEQAQMAAAEAQRVLTRLNFNRMQDLLDQKVVSKAEYDSATAESRQAEARVGEIRAAIERKTIRAPFTGSLGIRQVNKGQYLAGGDPVV